MTDRENWLRAINFQNPEWIPVSISFAPAVWHRHREGLENVIVKHPLLFGNYAKGNVNFDSFPNVYREGEQYTDNWGCVWFNAHGGLEGQVKGHPLADWEAFKSYAPPDPALKSERGDRNWDDIRKYIAEAKKNGALTYGDGERLFDRLYFLRGFENLMMDVATDDPRLPGLVEMLTDYEMRLVGMWLELGVDAMGFHTDIGTQRALMINPAKFRRYIKPMFKKIFQACRKAGSVVALSSDGCLLEIIDDLIESGVSMHDPQVRANTIDGIARAYKGKMCANVDLDRQMFAFCLPEDIKDQVKEVVEKIYSPKGGLMISAGMWDENIPIDNIEAMCYSLENVRKGRFDF